jgi:hypothetical protein
MLKSIAAGLLGRLVAYGIFGLGFWLLFRGVQDDNIPLAVLGGAMIPAGLFVLVKVRGWGSHSESDDSPRHEAQSSESSGDGSSE